MEGGLWGLSSQATQDSAPLAPLGLFLRKIRKALDQLSVCVITWVYPQAIHKDPFGGVGRLRAGDVKEFIFSAIEACFTIVLERVEALDSLLKRLQAI